MAAGESAPTDRAGTRLVSRREPGDKPVHSTVDAAEHPLEPFWDAYAPYYQFLQRSPAYSDLAERMIAPVLTSRAGSCIDLGCGTGNLALQLARRGVSVTAVDFAKEMLGIARKRRDKEDKAVQA